MITYALDLETFYSKDCSIAPLGLDQYVRHPDFDCYLMSVVADDDSYVYCGPLDGFPWDKLEGATLVSHNASFDHGVMRYLQATGKVPAFTPAAWHCTADMAAYLGSPRSLAEASSFLLKTPLSKTTRDSMINKRWADMSSEFQEEVWLYALNDSKVCLQLWTRFSDQWPEHERQISIMTRESGWHGLTIDVDGLIEDIAALRTLQSKIADRIPWVPGRALLSYPAFCEAVRDMGLIPPSSLDKKDTETAEWAAAHPEVTFIQDMQDYRSATVLVAKLETMLSRCRKEDGRMGYGMKYFGASTGRDSGDAGVNIQNLPRGEIAGVNLRKRITAAPGHVFVACDLGAIEPRALTYLARDTKTLDAARGVRDWYEAQARAWGLYHDPRPLKEGSPEIRHMIKGMSIGLGYGMSATKFASMSGIPLQEAEGMVALFRRKNAPICGLWKRLERGLASSHGGVFEVDLPSGRSLVYREVQRVTGNMTAVLPRNGKWMRLKLWHGLLVENCTQAFARDIFMDRVLAVRNAGFSVVMRVHDEVVVEVPIGESEAAAVKIKEIMTTSPAWCESLPLSADAKIGRTYYDSK